ncbi:Protein O-linked-mannose beta-1,4-N-acetylglucosaminyltransferase 2 [Holothuria leucospilota]|uniref:Protein O-linked-mannose beta-1,4-N-acetylglucosaminyltransferase 2 n=1 Tax=Holothuria leucospilota TaxID=206669 RepID=A0A9Q0YLR0_HOLLE|nr:Protein O-linked-mannose beta-1,4-N-acetylglucosaminyltransferase 2 [Holothuria leucospilota]
MTIAIDKLLFDSISTFRLTVPERTLGAEFPPEGNLNWCIGNSTNGTVCNFQNLCFFHRDNTFFLVSRNNSMSLYFDQPDRNVVKVTGVANLVTPVGANFPFYFSVVKPKFLDVVNKEGYLYRSFKEGKYLIYNSVVRENIMHNIHDDFLPIFNTMKLYDLDFSDKPVRTLIGNRAFGISDTPEFSNLFSKESSISFDDLSLEPDESITCFEDVTVGLSRDTTWYQYGAEDEPEGPISGSLVRLDHIENFTDFVRKGFNIAPVCTGSDYGVLFSRKSTRLILNEQELAKSIATSFDIKVIELSMERNSVSEIVESISCSKFAIGIHGSILIFSMFLPPYSLLLELYPFAMNPKAYTPYRTLMSIPGMDIEYLTWRNTNSSNTVTHPENSPFHGGIVHLSMDEQQRIQNSTEVPPHPCCYDPEFRYRLNQDTIVDIPAIIQILKSSRLFSKSFE